MNEIIALGCSALQAKRQTRDAAMIHAPEANWTPATVRD
jgi:hypothetical protein